MPIQDIDEVRKLAMHSAAERAKLRRQQEEAEIERQKERARKKAAELEAKIKAAEEAKRKEAEEKAKEQQKPSDAEVSPVLLFISSSDERDLARSLESLKKPFLL